MALSRYDFLKELDAKEQILFALDTRIFNEEILRLQLGKQFDPSRHERLYDETLPDDMIKRIYRKRDILADDIIDEKNVHIIRDSKNSMAPRTLTFAVQMFWQNMAACATIRGDERLHTLIDTLENLPESVPATYKLMATPIVLGDNNADLTPYEQVGLMHPYLQASIDSLILYDKIDDVRFKGDPIPDDRDTIEKDRQHYAESFLTHGFSLDDESEAIFWEGDVDPEEFEGKIHIALQFLGEQPLYPEHIPHPNAGKPIDLSRLIELLDNLPQLDTQHAERFGRGRRDGGGGLPGP